MRQADLGILVRAGGRAAGDRRGTGAARPTPVLIDDFEVADGWTVTRAPGSRRELVWERRRQRGRRCASTSTSATAPASSSCARTSRLTLPENFAFTFRLPRRGAAGDARVQARRRGAATSGGGAGRDFAFPTVWQTIDGAALAAAHAWGPAATRSARRRSRSRSRSRRRAGGGLALDRRPPARGARAGDAGRRVAAGDRVERRGPDASPSGSSTATGDALAQRRRCRDRNGCASTSAQQPRVRRPGHRLGPGRLRDRLRRRGLDRRRRPGSGVQSTETGKGGRDYVYMPDAESRFVRLVLERSSRGHGFGIPELAVEPVAFSESPNQFFAAIAREAPLRALSRSTSPAAVVLDGRRASTATEGGAAQRGGHARGRRGAFSIEPFLYGDGALVTWSDVATTQALEDGALPIPTVTWRERRAPARRHGLRRRAARAPAPCPRATGSTRRRRAPEPVRLFVAIRPFQVLPPWQSLNMVGGVAPIRESLRSTASAVWVNRSGRSCRSTPPDRLRRRDLRGRPADRLPRARRVARGARRSAIRSASRRARSTSTCASTPGATREVALVAVPFHEPHLRAARAPGRRASRPALRRRPRREWTRQLDRVELELPPAARRSSRRSRTTLGYILINRDGPALQPGLAHLRALVDPRRRADLRGAAPDGHHARRSASSCAGTRGISRPTARSRAASTARGADPTPEHDSNGEFIYALGEYYRYTRDVGFVHELWPNVIARGRPPRRAARGSA